MDVGIPWNNLLNNERDLDEIEKKILTHSIRKTHFIFIDHIMRKMVFENFKLTGYI